MFHRFLLIGFLSICALTQGGCGAATASSEVATAGQENALIIQGTLSEVTFVDEGGTTLYSVSRRQGSNEDHVLHYLATNRDYRLSLDPQGMPVDVWRLKARIYLKMLEPQFGAAGVTAAKRELSRLEDMLLGAGGTIDVTKGRGEVQGLILRVTYLAASKQYNQILQSATNDEAIRARFRAIEEQRARELDAHGFLLIQKVKALDEVN